MIAAARIDQSADPARTKRVAGWLWPQYLGVPVGPDYSTRLTDCQCFKGLQCKRPGKHPVSARELLWPFYEEGVTPTDPWRYASRDMADVDEWCLRGYSLAAYPLKHVVVDVEGGVKGGHASLREWARLYGIDLAEITEDTLTVITGGDGRHYWFTLPEPWRSDPPVELQPMDGWLPAVDIKMTTPERPNSKVTLPGSAHASGRPYTFAVRPDGTLPMPRVAPVRLLEALVHGKRWEPLAKRDRDALDALKVPLPAWRYARRFFGPDDPAPPRSVWRGMNVGSMSQLSPDHYLKRLPS